MRRPLAAGGIAIAACTCLLLFSGAASARQTSDTISISGVANGADVQFKEFGSPLTTITFLGGSNWDFTAISSPGGTCNVTPTNGGAFCSFSTPVTSFVANTTISGPIPTAVVGEVGYADASTGQFTAPVTAAPAVCHCSNVSAKFTHFKEEDHDTKFVFVLRLKVRCASGAEGHCAGSFDVKHPKLPGGLKVREGSEAWHGGPIHIVCHAKEGTCPSTLTFEKKLELIGLPEVRAHEAISFHVSLHCVQSDKEEHEELTLGFDGKGNLNRRKSHLGS
jgi:hypothetical protein